TILGLFYGKPSGIVTTSFRIMPAAFARTIVLYRMSFPQLGPLIVRLTHKIHNVPVEHRPRPLGSSGYGLFKLIKETYRSIIHVTLLPLRIFSIAGIITAALAFLYGVYSFILWLAGGVGVPGFTSLILAIMFFGGMLLVEVGILGEYIGRIILELTGMPRYAIYRQVGVRDEQDH
ncbi:MAG TPA: hypothetical protein PKY55_13950, partial [bacterium]|nr:hypothetical protein [bacterium]HPG84382.1 hypothetical protein [bacterium]